MVTTDKRLGEYLREVAALSSPQIVQALRQQIVDRDRGRERRIGEILVGLGHVGPDEIEIALRRQIADRIE